MILQKKVSKKSPYKDLDLWVDLQSYYFKPPFLYKIKLLENNATKF